MGSRRWVAANGSHCFSISSLTRTIIQQGTIFSCNLEPDEEYKNISVN